MLFSDTNSVRKCQNLIDNEPIYQSFLEMFALCDLVLGTVGNQNQSTLLDALD
jgi:hypothetical protein